MMGNIEKRFWKHHRKNPHVYELLVKYALEAKEAGFEVYGMKSIFERVRWHVHMETRTTEKFKMSNDFSSRYARLIMQQIPELRGFFKTRTLSTSTSIIGRSRTPIKKKRVRTPMRKK